MTTRYKANKSMMRGLEKRAQQLQQQHIDLQAQRGSLQLREHLLRAFCEAMAALQQHSSGGHISCDDAMSEEALQQLLHAEGDLLQQLQAQAVVPQQPQQDEQQQNQPLQQESQQLPVPLQDPQPQEQEAAQQQQQDSGSGGGSDVAPAATAQPPAICRSSSHTSGSTVTSGSDGSLPPMAPPSQPLAFFYRHLHVPLEPDAATLSVQDMASRLRCSTLELSVQLHRLGSGPKSTQEEALAKMWELWDRYARLLLSIVLVGRMDVADSVNAMDMGTLVLDAEGANSQDGRMADVVHSLKLTPAQSGRVAEGLPVIMSLLQPVRSERTALQAAVASMEVLSVADDAAAAGSGSNGLANGGSSGHAACAQQQQQQQQQHAGGSAAVTAASTGDAGSVSARVLHPISCRQQQLQLQHARLIRLQQLLAKEYVLRTIAAFWFIGCLDISQATRAAVLSWPYFWRPLLLAAEVAKSHARQQQPQQKHA